MHACLSVLSDRQELPLPSACPLSLPALCPCLPQVYAVCGDDYRLYASPIIKFQKACYQLVNGNAWYISGAHKRGDGR